MADQTTDQERYETIDRPFYEEVVAPILPAGVLDFHAHIWRADQWLPPAAGNWKGTGYVVTERDYSVEQLLRDARRMFPDRAYSAVLFGQPTPAVSTEATNAYVAVTARAHGLYPLRVLGRGQVPQEQLRKEMSESPFFGYKVFLPWIGDTYAQITPEDMIGPDEMEVADELGLIVLLHVPTAKRLGEKRVQESIMKYSRDYSNASIVLAHCGRCYLPGEMKGAVGSLRGLDNVYLDTAMIMDPTVLGMVLQTIDSSRLLYATDYPVAAMRGRRVYVMDHWVDVVLEGYPRSAFRAASSSIRATFMAWEIVLAIQRAAEMAGLPPKKTRRIFYDNGVTVLRRVMDGRKLEAAPAPHKDAR